MTRGRQIWHNENKGLQGANRNTDDLITTISIFFRSIKMKRKEKLFWKLLEGKSNAKTCRGAGKNQRGADPITELQPFNWFWKALKLLDLDLHHCGVVTDYLLQFHTDMESKLRITKSRVNHYARITPDIFLIQFLSFFSISNLSQRNHASLLNLIS